VTRSAVSQSLRRLEDELGVALILRTTRSARLTDAGARLRNEAAPALAQVGRAVQAVGSSRAEPSGSLRIAVSSIAEPLRCQAKISRIRNCHEHRKSVEVDRHWLAYLTSVFEFPQIVLDPASRHLPCREMETINE
jgi:DNA-binding transcriptional LysR family regulator